MDLLFLSEESFWSVSSIIAIVSAAFAFVGGIYSSITAARASWYAKRKDYSSVVAHRRLVWVEKMRSLTAELSAFCAAHEGAELSAADKGEFERLRSELLIRLTPKELCQNEDGVIEKYANDLELISILEKDFKYVCENITTVRSTLTTIFKEEWDRALSEAGLNEKMEKEIKERQEEIRKSREEIQ